MQSPQRYTVTAALIYANGPIHIGHLAGCYVPADIYVRYLRSNRREVAFISGTDEHGVPITIRAKKEGVTPQEVVDKYYTQIADSFAELGISFDVYSRTSKPVHHETSQEIFKDLYDKGVFIEETTGAVLRRNRPAVSGRPLHRGYLPGLRQSQRLRRPVRALRLHAQPHGADRPALHALGRAARV